MTKQREVFKIITTNTAELTAGSHFIVQDVTNARHHSNLPHNSAVITNTNTSCTLHIYLDEFNDDENADYVLFPSQQITIPVEDGASWSVMYIKNTHATTSCSADEIKVRISTVKEVM